MFLKKTGSRTRGLTEESTSCLRSARNNFFYSSDRSHLGRLSCLPRGWSLKILLPALITRQTIHINWILEEPKIEGLKFVPRLAS